MSLTELQTDLLEVLEHCVNNFHRGDETRKAFNDAFGEINARLDALEARNKYDDDCNTL